MIAGETLAAIDRQVGAVTNRWGRKFPWLRDDIQQQAWATSLASAHRYDPVQPGARGYFYRIASLAVAENITRWTCVASVSRHEARHGVPEELHRAHAVTDGCQRVDCGEEEDVLSARDLVRRAGELYFGAAGPYRSISWIGEHLGVSRREASRAVGAYRALVQDHEKPTKGSR